MITIADSREASDFGPKEDEDIVFARVDCATSQLEPFRCSLLPQQEQVEDSGIDVIRFPVVDQSVILFSHILKDI
ncbi:hypothetical protein LguiA_024519 [Lonicera macranthoides]